MGFFSNKSQPSKGAADNAKQAEKDGKIAKGKSSQVVQRKAGSGGNRQGREEKRQ
jgi:hypothetical protein